MQNDDHNKHKTDLGALPQSKALEARRADKQGILSKYCRILQRTGGHKYIIALSGLALFSGCATSEHHANSERPIVVSPQMVDLAGEPNQIKPTKEPERLHDRDPMPVWRSARVQRVYMAGHVNENNEAYYRSQKEVIVEPGEWNLDALNNPQLSYIPEANTVPIPTEPGRNYTNMVSPGKIAPNPIEEMEEVGEEVQLDGVDNARVLGLMEYSQEAQARSMENETHIAVFYKDLGWCLVSREQLAPVKSMPNG